MAPGVADEWRHFDAGAHFVRAGTIPAGSDLLPLLPLQAAGCRAFQGFLLAEPMPPHELGALLAAHGESRERQAAAS